MTPDRIIHISFGGPDRWLQCAGKVWLFEDHPHCGPIVLTPKTGEVAERQPGPDHMFWSHVSNWYQQGKKTNIVGSQVWCEYVTDWHVKRAAAKGAA